MIRFALLKIGGFVATVLVAAAIIFFALDVLPGDPARFMLGISATPDAVAALQAQLGLDAPGWHGISPLRHPRRLTAPRGPRWISGI